MLPIKTHAYQHHASICNPLTLIVFYFKFLKFFDCTVDSLITKCIQTKNLNTQAMVEDGGTLIVGGIYEEDNSDTINKVPLLGDIPVVGNLFKSRAKKEERRELLIFITPRIMDGVGSNLRY